MVVACHWKNWSIDPHLIDKFLVLYFCCCIKVIHLRIECLQTVQNSFQTFLSLGSTKNGLSCLNLFQARKNLAIIATKRRILFANCKAANATPWSDLVAWCMRNYCLWYIPQAYIVFKNTIQRLCILNW